MIRMKPKSLFLSFLFFSSILGLSSSDTIAQQCSSALTKVMDCLQYSTGKAAEPTGACCTSTKEVRKDDPVCLCFFIQQTFKGVPEIKTFGVKVDRLLLLPSACKLTNTSVADCPKLLNLSPTSPDAAIFTNATNSSSPVTTNPTSNNDSASHGTIAKSHFGVVYSVMVAVFFSMLSIRP
ncbi:non-specific lipid transfer protein GPI-anchored 1-like protein [Cinnamomum micranthum f. kanehirae]|uniref:Non-specific lipid transfer protein GPI-anchored 1-like protein n=1 Tax=Cinnamomum micranthum f. kanehirae TaxID=337451 RepID=A0A443P8C8_9MAGN|nr:non-specific lipid transfer protein GPI-anchored 1-like protein [Cinnamomum micranthum f. kanehirae]